VKVLEDVFRQHAIAGCGRWGGGGEVILHFSLPDSCVTTGFQNLKVILHHRIPKFEKSPLENIIFHFRKVL
jgi:hypothetical protein